MLVTNSYISSNCNQTPQAAHWGKNKLICYCSCNAVMIYDPEHGSGGKVIDTLVGHSKRVNSVKWLSGRDHEVDLISGSSDGTAIVWTYENDCYKSTILSGHTSVVTIVDGLYRNDDAVVVTASMDSSVKVWCRLGASGEFTLQETLNFNLNICVGMRAIIFPQSTELLLACATDNFKIKLFTENKSEVDNLRLCLAECLEGHEDWVRGLDFTTDENGNILLASSAQDNTIRLWKISKIEPQNQIGSTLVFSKPHTLTIDHKPYSIQSESVLVGHEGWVYSVSWHPNELQLLSASIDKSMVIWEYDQESKLWIEAIRVGEVGGNTLGFYGGVFGPDGRSILGHGYNGAFHIWKKNEKSDLWDPQVTIGGHFDEVVDLKWEPEGKFLISVSKDKTTRIHAPWRGNQEATWHEIARPQVHGYDLNSVTFLSKYTFASSAEEKVIRVFRAPKNFVENFRRITGIQDDENDECMNEGYFPKGASVPSLGLSNKAVFTDNNIEAVHSSVDKVPYPEESHFTAVELYEPPTEETLLQNTLWPEIQKLYGHGYEVYTLASSPDGKLLASACKATTKEHAAILLWDTNEWKIKQKLFSHTLTVTQIAFSPDSLLILSVSRDRRWSLFSLNETTNEYDLVATTDKTTSVHTRIIWCCAWTYDSLFFVTGSRDGKIVAWNKNTTKRADSILGQYESITNHIDLEGSVTALAFTPCRVSCGYLMAAGLESGIIQVYSFHDRIFKLITSLEPRWAHHLAVRRLMFSPVVIRPGREELDHHTIELASCGADQSVRIYEFNMETLVR